MNIHEIERFDFPRGFKSYRPKKRKGDLLVRIAVVLALGGLCASAFLISHPNDEENPRQTFIDACLQVGGEVTIDAPPIATTSEPFYFEYWDDAPVVCKKKFPLDVEITPEPISSAKDCLTNQCILDLVCGGESDYINAKEICSR